MTRMVCYNVVATLDGCIAGPNGEYDWIPHDPTVDFAAMFAAVDTFLIGRKTWQVMQAGPSAPMGDKRIYVFSTTLRPDDCPGATVVSRDAAGVVAALRAEPGDKGIWLFGGGALFRALLAAGQVDRLDVTIAPVLLGGGIPLYPPGPRAPLKLLGTHTYPTGMVTLRYAVGERD